MKMILALFFIVNACLPTPNPKLTDRPARAALWSSVAMARIEGVGAGTAFAISPNVLISAAHVCDGPDGVPLTVNGVLPEYYGYSRGLEVCVIYLPSHGLRPLRLADQPPELAQHVWTIGYPALVGPHLTEGYAEVEVMLTPDEFPAEIQDYAGLRRLYSLPAYPGNSGGPIVNDDGEVIGVLVAGEVPDYSHLSYGARLEDIKASLVAMGLQYEGD